jgi:hypothetical protein
MNQYGPEDLTGQVVLKPGPPFAAGGFASVHHGYWNDKLVNILDHFSCNIHISTDNHLL